MEIQRIMKEYYDQLCNCKSDNPDKMDQFLERHKLPKLTQEEIIWIALSIKEIYVILNNNMIALREWWRRTNLLM